MPPEVPALLEVRCAAAIAEEPATAEGAPRARTLSAQLLTYGLTINPHSTWGMPVRLLDAALQAPEQLNDVKLLRDHDPARVIGALTDIEATDAGPRGTFRLARTAAADEAFMLAEDGIIDAVSVGLRILDYAFVREDDTEIVEVSRAALHEVSLVGAPADSTARIDSVTARKATTMTVPPQAETPAEFTAAQMDAVLAHVRDNMAPLTAAPVAPPAITSTRLVDGNGRAIVLASDRRDERIPTAIGNDGRPYTAGDYFASYAQAVREGNFSRYQEIKAALADELTTDIPGLLPQAIVGEILGKASGRRPVWESFSPRDMPMSGAKFSRPRITQHVLVGDRGTEKTNPPSQKFKVELAEVAKKVFAGGLDVSNEALDWSSPSLLNELVIDFTRIYASYTEQYGSTQLVAATTAGAQTVTWDGKPETLAGVLASAAVLVAQGVGPEVDAFPNTIWISLDVWAQIAGLTDTTGRQLLPQVGPANALGGINLADPTSGPSGTNFRWAVGRHLPAGTFIMGDRDYVEAYENGRRLLQAQNVPALGLDIAYMGYGAVYAPYPKTLVKITITPPAEPVAATTTK